MRALDFCGMPELPDLRSDNSGDHDTKPESDLVPSVSVIVSHFNSARTIQQCLTSLRKQNYPSSRFEIVVVDAGSSDGSINIVNQLKIPNLRQLIITGCTEPEG
ncbi:MAG: glycosyltransferase, partial [Nitrososphaerales archaeon]